jgi:hypothetical protein
MALCTNLMNMIDRRTSEHETTQREHEASRRDHVTNQDEPSKSDVAP